MSSTESRSFSPAGPAGENPPDAKSGSLSWVPIRSLLPRHRPRIARHLLALQPQDRYLRFGHLAGDAQIERYVETLDFERDEVFGVFNRRLTLVAMAHLAYLGSSEGSPAAVEFGVSVEQAQRGRGLGARLFSRAVLHARNRRIDTMVIYALTENLPMLHIAQRAGAVVRREGSEATALLQLPTDDVGSQVEELLEHHAAELDYGLKQRNRQFDGLPGRLCSPQPDVGTTAHAHSVADGGAVGKARADQLR